MTLSNGSLGVGLLAGCKVAGRLASQSLPLAELPPAAAACAQDIRGFSRTEWCAALAAVSQEPVLFPASIAYNIGAGPQQGRGKQGRARHPLPLLAAAQAWGCFSHHSPRNHLTTALPRPVPPCPRLRPGHAVQPGGD